MFLATLFIAFKVVLCIVSAVGAIGLLIGAVICVGALIAAIFRVFPVVGIVLAVIITALVIFLIAHCISLTAKERKRKKLYETAKKNREKRLKEISEDQK